MMKHKYVFVAMAAFALAALRHRRRNMHLMT